MSNWALRALAVLSVSAALVVVVAPNPTEAATSSVSIAGASKTNAPDIKSKGTIKTPTVKTSGNVTVSSRSYVITKGKKTVARTSTQGKTYKLGVGTYKMKSTTKYRTHTIKTLSTGRWVEADGIEYDNVKSCRITSYRDTSAGDDGWWTVIADGECKGKDGSLWRGEVLTDSAYGALDLESFKEKFSPGTWSSSSDALDWGLWQSMYNKWVPNVQKTYSSYKTTSKTQTVKVSNSPVMTLREYKAVKNKAKLSKVKSIVGGTGKVVDRWSYGNDDYVMREFSGHYIYFEDGRVYAKQW